MNPGGFLEPCASTEVRPRPRVALPDRGPFTFPAPYNTIGVRLTNASDTGGEDALWYAGYSYWRNLNAHAADPYLLAFLGVDRQRGGDGPSLWMVDKATNEVSPLGPIFPPEHALSWATGEGWYWSATEPTILYASDPTHLYRVDVAPILQGRGAPTITTAVDFTSWPSKIAWQWHTSADDSTHSATVKDAVTYAAQAAVVFRAGSVNPWAYYEAQGQLDECQVDKAGAWLLVKDNIDRVAGEDNVILTLGDGSRRTILDQDGAAGHSDNGHGYMIAADNYHVQPGALCLWMFDAGATPQHQLCYHTPSWDAEMNHVSHCNAAPGAPAGQYVVGSGASRTAAPRNNEIVGFRLDGSLEALVIAPVMTDLDAPGGGTDDYAKLPKGNLDTTGEYFLWTSNWGGPRLDAFLVCVPGQLLIPSPTPPTPQPPAQDTWTVTAPDGTVRHFVEVARGG